MKGLANTYLDALPEALAAKGYHVTELHMAEAGSWWKPLRVEHHYGNTHRISIWNSGVYAGVPPGTGAVGVAEPRKDVIPTAKLRKVFVDLLDEIAPDVIHIQNLFGFPVRLLEEATKRGIPVAMTEHGYNPICPTVHLFLECGQPCSLGRDTLVCRHCSRRSSTYPVFRLERAFNVLMGRVVNHGRAWKLLNSIKSAIDRFASFHRSLWQKNDGYLMRYDEMCKMLRGLDLLHCISEVQAARLQQATGPLPNLKVRPIVPQTIRRVGSIGRAKSPDNQVPTFVVLNIFPWRDDKGWSYLQRVVMRLEQQRRDFRVLWYADASSPHKCIQYRGRYDHGDLDTIASVADACLMPSLWLETLGFTGMELLARGVPLICSNRCGVSQMVRNGVTGVVFDPSSEENLCQVLNSLLDAPAKLGAMRQAQSEACVHMQTFDEHIDEFAGMLESLLHARCTAHGSATNQAKAETIEP